MTSVYGLAKQYLKSKHLSGVLDNDWIRCSAYKSGTYLLNSPPVKLAWGLVRLTMHLFHKVGAFHSPDRTTQGNSMQYEDNSGRVDPPFFFIMVKGTNATVRLPVLFNTIGKFSSAVQVIQMPPSV